MRYFFIVVLSFLISSVVHSQDLKDISNKHYSFDFFKIGDSLENYRNLLTNSDYHFNEIENIDTIKSANVFRFYPSLKSAVDIASVSFNTILILIDDNKRAKSFTFWNVYDQKNAINLDQLLENNNDSIINYLNEYLKIRGVRSNNRKKVLYGYLQQEKTIWLNGNLEYILTASKDIDKDTKQVTLCQLILSCQIKE